MNESKNAQQAPGVLWAAVVTRLPVALLAALQRRPRLLACLRVVVLVAVFVMVDRLILRLAALPPEAYFQPVLSLELAARVGWPLGLAALGVLVLLTRFGALGCRWEALGGRALRGFVVFLAALLSWFVVTRGYNFYFDQAHWFDKALLLVLLALAWHRPLWVLPLSVLLAVAILQQAAPPLGASVLAHKLQLLHVLHLFSASLLLHAVTGRTRAAEFVFVTCCMVAGSYFTAALAKIELQWWAHDQLYLLPFAAHAHGWLDPLGAGAITGLAEMLKPLDPLMRWSVLVIETGCLLMLVQRRLTVALLAALVVFHLGVLALYGFFFWTWIALDVALLVLLLRSRDVVRALGAGAAGRVLSVLLIASAVFWSRPPWLGWLDTGLTYTYRFEALGESGRRYALRPEFFAPYEDVFTMTPFTYLAREHRVLTASYGVTKEARVARALGGARGEDEVVALEESLGRDAYDERSASRLREFVARYAANRNRYPERPASLFALAPPAQFISHRPGVTDTGADRIVEIGVVEFTSGFDGTGPSVFRRLEVERIAIPATMP